MNRQGTWMQTVSGKAFWPIDPRPEELDIGDIAHALSMMCRYGGHCSRFYSVAEHSVLMASYALPNYGDEIAKIALMHDATEAYLTDVIRPIKAHLSNYKEIEERLWLCIAERFGLPKVIPDVVHHLDNAILRDEMNALHMPPPMECNIPAVGLGTQIAGWEPSLAKWAFMGMYQRLWGETC
jgi:hypothetical protein